MDGGPIDVSLPPKKRKKLSDVLPRPQQAGLLRSENGKLFLSKSNNLFLTRKSLYNKKSGVGTSQKFEFESGAQDGARTADFDTSFWRPIWKRGLPIFAQGSMDKFVTGAKSSNNTTSRGGQDVEKLLHNNRVLSPSKIANLLRNNNNKLGYLYNIKDPVNGAPVIRPSSKKVTEKSNENDRQSSDNENIKTASVVDYWVDGSQKGPVCFKCRDVSPDGELMLSCAYCSRTWHSDCLTLAEQKQKTFNCKDCMAGEPRCQYCMKSAKEKTVVCSDQNCRRVYHESCLRKSVRIGDKTPTKGGSEPIACCPMHVCHTCVTWNREKEVKSGDFMRCLLCTSTYHRKDECIPAGCEFLGRKILLCPRHFDEKRAALKPSHINVDWCFSGSCKHGGTLVCCEQCPAAFHAECLELDKVPEETYLCLGCKEDKRPMFNDLVWAKIGAYRWWPAKVLHPLNVPDNIEAKRHSVGEFPVLFLGSQDYQYVSKGRVFAYCEGDKGSMNDGASKNMNKAYKKALEEAEEWVKKKKMELLQKKAVDSLSMSNRFPSYRMLKENLAYDVSAKVLLKEDPCDCNPEKDRPCSEDDNCSNRLMQIECDDRCPAKQKCCNKRFQRGENAKALPFKTDGRGWGLRALKKIEKGSFVCEYIGELTSQKEMKRRWKEKTVKNEDGFYFLTLDKDRTIDACYAGNIARFMNHSCQPNCSTHVWQVNTDERVGLFADRNIDCGEELTFHYNMDSLDAEVKLPCHCGAKNCLGYIGKKRQKNGNNNGESGNGHQKKNGGKQKKKKAPRYEKECFRCGDGGTLLCCDRRNCPKGIIHKLHDTCIDNISV